MGEGGREGDWECMGCKNRNYAFRSFCNRCKQPRLLVDSHTPSHSKWLPRFGDWICSGCTNNNYASREKCKKCGQPKEIAAMPAIAIPGATLPAYSHYLARVHHGGAEEKMSVGLLGNGSHQQPLPLAWADKYGVHLASPWSLGGNLNSGANYANPSNQFLVIPKGWRNGDWICSCGFHNYSSRAQCKKCNSFPPALGTKRLASDEFVHDWDNKRLHIGHEQANGQQQQQQQSLTGFDHQVGTVVTDSKSGVYTSYSGVSPSLQLPMLSPQHANSPVLLGKGAKQWREGDWMCSSCNNHNYASRSHCNRCKTVKEATAQSVNAI